MIDNEKSSICNLQFAKFEICNLYYITDSSLNQINETDVLRCLVEGKDRRKMFFSMREERKRDGRRHDVSSI